MRSEFERMKLHIELVEAAKDIRNQRYSIDSRLSPEDRRLFDRLNTVVDELWYREE